MIAKLIKRVSLKKFLEFCVVTTMCLLMIAHFHQMFRKMTVTGYGKRMGVVTKITERGLVKKSWEGQLFVPGTEINYSSGALDPDVWDFSVSNTNIVKKIESLVGMNVVVTYTREFRPFKQETIFDVTAITTNNVPQVFIEIDEPGAPYPKFIKPQNVSDTNNTISNGKNVGG